MPALEILEYFKKIFLNFYVFILRERVPSRLHAISAEPNSGLDLMNCELKSRARCFNSLSHPGTPLKYVY